MEVHLTNFGATIVSLMVPDRHGKFRDVALGYQDQISYEMSENHPYIGSVVGRFGNRIAHGKWTLDGKTYTLARNNNGIHHLHGGAMGFDQRLWTVDPLSSDNTLILSYLSPDGEENYPGNLHTQVLYRLLESNTLEIEYQAKTDQPTPVNLTNHCYFNLEGEGHETILQHELQIFSDQYIEADEELIPTGKLNPVEGTPFDFRAPQLIGKQILSTHPQIQSARGYDLHFEIRPTTTPESLKTVAHVKAPQSGIMMTVKSTEPGVQFYSGNFLDGTRCGKSGKKYPPQSGFCLETQHAPDSPNHPQFPNTILRPGETFISRTLYEFTTQNT